MSFILAAFGLLVTLVWCLLLILANASMVAPSMTGHNVVGPLILGVSVSALIAASHWLPHIGW